MVVKGDDIIDCGTGADQLTVGVCDIAGGGNDGDTFILDFSQTSGSGSNAVAIDGGISEDLGTDNDTQDLTGLGEYTLTQTTDVNGDSTSGTATYASGQVANFSEIENLINYFTLVSMILTDRGKGCR